MKPLQSIAMGLLIVAVGARINGYDVLPDPIGWLLVLQGLGRLPAALPHRSGLQTLGFLALVMSVVLWFPDLATGLEREDVSLLWLANLPQLAFVALLCRSLAVLAAGAGDARAAGWLHTACALTVLAAVLATGVLATRPADLVLVVMVLGAITTLVLVIVLAFRYSSRPWSQAPLDQTTAAGPGPGS